MTAGLGAKGILMKPVEESTMNMPIRRGGPDRRIRKTVNPNKSRPIQATGKTIRSIKTKRKGNTYEISSRTGKGDMILEVNRKLGRDPLQITEAQIRILEDDLVRSFEKIILSV